MSDTGQEEESDPGEKEDEDDLYEAGYTDQEIDSILDFYRKYYKEGVKKGRRLVRIETIEILLNNKFKTLPFNYKEKLEEASDAEIDKIYDKIFDVEEFNEIEDYFYSL